jgi:hypothetical protein
MCGFQIHFNIQFDYIAYMILSQLDFGASLLLHFLSYGWGFPLKLHFLEHDCSLIIMLHKLIEGSSIFNLLHVSTGVIDILSNVTVIDSFNT